MFFLISMDSTFLPDSATEAISTPCFWDMYPRMEKMAKPDTKLVPLFNRQRKKESLQFRNNPGSVILVAENQKIKLK